MCLLDIDSFENCGYEGLLAKTDSGATGVTVFLVVDFNAEELA